MIPRRLLILVALGASAVTVSFAQTQKPITNADIVNMTKQDFDPSLIVKDIQSSKTDFETSPQALIDLKNAGVDKSVMDAMLSAQARKPSDAVDSVRSAPVSGGGAAADFAGATCGA